MSDRHGEATLDELRQTLANLRAELGEAKEHIAQLEEKLERHLDLCPAPS